MIERIKALLRGASLRPVSGNFDMKPIVAVSWLAFIALHTERLACGIDSRFVNLKQGASH